MSLDRYRTFGFRENWLTNYLLNGRIWLDSSFLGKYQKVALVRYLKDAEIIDCKGDFTALGFILRKFINSDIELVWQVIWINLAQNSELFSWYATEIPWDSTFSREELELKLSNEKGVAPRTARNAVNALINTFKNSILGDWAGKIKKKTITKERLKTLKPELLSYITKRFDLGAEERFEFVQRFTGVDSLTYSSAFVISENLRIWEGL